jgi:phosphoribosylformylglycinamidine cyclo-ligase
LARGYVGAARAAGVVVVNGEVAELGDRIGGYTELDGYSPAVSLIFKALDRLRHRKRDDFNYNWGAAALWIAHKDRILTGHQIKSGDALIGLVEPGFRSNGITDVRKAMRQEYGRRWHEQTASELGTVSLGELVQTPSTIYSKFISDVTGGFDISKEPKATVTGVAHITGGGQPSKLGRMLEPSGLGAVIDNPIEPPKIMLHVQRIRGLTDQEAYKKWHMGPGMIVSTPEPDKFLAYAYEAGVDAEQIGYISSDKGIRSKNKGAVQDEEWLTFDRAA